MQNISLKAIAEELGVSYMTVYRVINGIPKVKEQTRNRIVDSLNQHGFSTLECRRQRRIIYAIDLNWAYMSYIVDAINTSFLPGNYKWEIIRPDLYSIEFMKAVESADYIVLFENITEKFIRGLRECNPDLTIISLFNGKYGDIIITPDDFMIGTIAADYLNKKGHRKHVAVLTALKDCKRQSSFINRYRGFMSQMKVLSPGCRIDLLDCSMMQESCIQRIISYFKKKKSMPSAFFCTGHFFFVHFYHQLEKLGIKIPENVGVMGCDRPDYLGNSVYDEIAYDRVTFDIKQLVNLTQFFLSSNIIFKKIVPLTLKLDWKLEIAGTVADISG